MARVLERGLRRTVGVPGLFATAYGNVGSSIYYALGLVAAHALGLTPLVFLLAGGLFALTAKTYAEGASMFPEAGGSSSFARHAFNEVASFFAGWALTLDYIITIAISAFFVPHYLGAFFPALKHNPGDIIGGVVVIAILAGLNIRGLRESASLNIFLAVTDLLTQVALVVLGAALIFKPAVLVNQVHLGLAPSWGQVIFALSISMVAYTGIETVSNMAEEARDPDHDVPRTVNYVLLAVLGIFAGISIISLMALPVTRDATGHFTTALGTTYKQDPVLGIVSALPLGHIVHTAFRYYVGVLAATILVIATNAGLRDLAAVLVAGRAPPTAARFARVHSRYRTPWFTIAVFSSLATVLLIPEKTDFSATSTASGPCSRSRRPTCRSWRFASRTPIATGPTGCPGTCGSEAGSCRSPRWSEPSAPSRRGSRWSSFTARPAPWGWGGWSLAWPVTSCTGDGAASIRVPATGSRAGRRRRASGSSPTARRSCRCSART